MALLALWKIPQWQVADPTLSVKERLELQDKARGTLAQIIGGMVVLVGLYFTGRSAAAAWRNVQVNAEGQITERFTRAIEQLGSNKLAIRLGGIYALERIAQDSPKDHWPIMEVLTAYVREHAPWKDSPQPQEGTTPELEEPTLERSIQQKTPQPEPKPAADIQAILMVLGRRSRWYRQGENQPLDLRKTDLGGANLTGAHLERAILVDAHLEHAFLMGAHLERAILGRAHLERTNLTRARLEEAILGGTHLEEPDLTEAHLEGARLVGAHLEDADLGGAHLEGASFERAHLEGASFGRVHPAAANFVRAHLDAARLTGAAPEFLRLVDATGITKEQLASAFIDERTRLPDYLTTEEACGNNPTASAEAP